MIFLFTGLILNAQNKVNTGLEIIRLGEEDLVKCPISYDHNSYYIPPQFNSDRNIKKKALTFEAEYFNMPDDFIQAFDFVFEIMANHISSDVTIRVAVAYSNLGSGVLAQAGPAALVMNFENAPLANTLYPIALAEKIAGRDLNDEDEFDAIVQIGNGVEWYPVPNDPNGIRGRFDLGTVFMHELIHTLGFFDSFFVNEEGEGRTGANSA